jgi:cytochrome c biogenesis protein CcmG/thiol:disulfide interchange protein DsbE
MSENDTQPKAAAPAKARRLKFVIPAVLFVALVVVLGVGLTKDPSVVPSALIDKPVPEFALEPVLGADLGLSAADLRADEVSLVNVFASWCGPCRAEHPLLMKLHDDGVVTLHGINYKDRPEDAQAWLAQLGDPFERIGADLNGRVGIDWGVYGVPETFIVDATGRIRYKHVGVLSVKDLEETILPLLESLRP